MDKHILDFNAKARLVGDNRQWIIQTRNKPKSKWKSKHFINSTRGVLLMVLDENNIVPTKKANAAIFAMPSTYRAWASKNL